MRRQDYPKEVYAVARKWNIDSARKAFEERGYVLLETEYRNVDTKMKYRCPSHPDKELEMSLAKLNQGRGCPYCAGVGKLTIEDVRKAFEKRGYELLEDCYVNERTKMAYRCPIIRIKNCQSPTAI